MRDQATQFGETFAELKYLANDFHVVRPGEYVKCAVTGRPIQLDDLKYWSVEKQEAYIDVEASMKADLTRR